MANTPLEDIQWDLDDYEIIDENLDGSGTHEVRIRGFWKDNKRWEEWEAVAVLGYPYSRECLTDIDSEEMVDSGSMYE